MRWSIREAAMAAVLGVLVAGPIAALALVALPARWRGPVVPWAILALSVVVVSVIRHRSPPP